MLSPPVSLLHIYRISHMHDSVNSLVPCWRRLQSYGKEDQVDESRTSEMRRTGKRSSCFFVLETVFVSKTRNGVTMESSLARVSSQHRDCFVRSSLETRWTWLVRYRPILSVASRSFTRLFGPAFFAVDRFSFSHVSTLNTVHPLINNQKHVVSTRR